MSPRSSLFLSVPVCAYSIFIPNNLPSTGSDNPGLPHIDWFYPRPQVIPTRRTALGLTVLSYMADGQQYVAIAVGNVPHMFGLRNQ